MTLERDNELRQFLQQLAESLDISDAQYEAAVKHYEAVGDWLNKDDSSIAKYEPQIYPQGSFRLGTMIKPFNDAEQYDIDLVCELKALRKEDVSQKQLKDMIGDRLKENERYRKGKMIEEKNRCWRLNYADSARFHMDILPAIPDDDINGSTRLIGANLAESAILITDRELYHWQHSNPKGYAEWFKQQMKVRFDEQRKLLAESIRADVEDVPEYKVKTPLQRAIQILKRHRDIRFADDPDNKPISIIITTLAAHAYDNEADLLEALQNIITKMPGLIERDEQGNALVTNPVNPLENFADKWKKHPELETKFRQWLQQVRADLKAALQAGTLSDMIEELKPRFGDRIVNEAASRAFPDHSSSAKAVASVAPSIRITKPGNKPWGHE
jgi:mannitol/fructose-specific phosphotransferase system IIA component (Ntr-type)